MKVSLVSVIGFLAASEGVAEAVGFVGSRNNDDTKTAAVATAAVSDGAFLRSGINNNNNDALRRLRRTEEFGLGNEEEISEAPTMAMNVTSEAPTVSPDSDLIDGLGEDMSGQEEERTPEPTSEGADGEFGADPDTDMEGGDEAPTEAGMGGGDEAPTEDLMDQSPAASPIEAGVDEAPTMGGDNDEFEDGPTASPSVLPLRTEYPTAGTPTYDEFVSPSASVPSNGAYPTRPTYSSPSYAPPTPKPYVSNEDDPILGPASSEGDGASDGMGSGYEWNNSTVEELEHDQTVIIALSVVFGVMFLFSVFVAHQMLENPHGCCASICRITVACWCGLLRFFCYPCRAMFGCTGQSKRNHMIVPDDQGNYTHDLELS